MRIPGPAVQLPGPVLGAKQVEDPERIKPAAGPPESLGEIGHRDVESDNLAVAQSDLDEAGIQDREKPLGQGFHLLPVQLVIPIELLEAVVKSASSTRPI